ncbi:MAG: hypothetical protein ACD_46C00132G0002 [uncultured bacterium]|nr:MAG: hypothetical protein ACD_46C00132G0002 [uncultured bacterium]
MQSRQFEELVSTVFHSVKHGLMSTGPVLFGMQAATECDSLTCFLKYGGEKNIAKLRDFISRYSGMPPESIQKFFSDYEFTLNQKTLENLRACQNKKLETDNKLVACYEFLLKQQNIFRNENALDLKSKVDSIINVILVELNRTKQKLTTKQELLQAEIDALKASDSPARLSVFYNSDTIEIKKGKHAAVHQLLDEIILVEKQMKTLMEQLATCSLEEYPSISDLRRVLMTSYQSISTQINKIIAENKYIGLHAGCGVIADKLIKIFTFGACSYSADTNKVINDSMQIVDQCVRRVL